MAKKDTVQFNLRPPREVIRRLDELAHQYGFVAATEVAVEVLQYYTDLWAAAEQAKRDAIKNQHEALRRAIQSEMLKLPIKQATTESRTQAQGKKGRR